MVYRKILAAVALVVVLTSAGNADPTTKEVSGAPVGQFHLLDQLRGRAGSATTLRVEDVIAANGDLYFFVKADRSRSAPAAFVRTTKSGEILAYVNLETGDDIAMDVTSDGRVVAADLGMENLLVFGADGSLQSSMPLEFSLANWCKGAGDLSRLCLLLDGRLPQPLMATPPLMLRMGFSDGGFAVVDGVEAVLHLGDRHNLQPDPIELSNPTLDPIREIVSIETAKDHSKALLIMDAESHHDALYLLLGSGTRAGEGVIMRYDRVGRYLDSRTYQVPMMPQFVAVGADRLYLSDHLGNVAVYALP